jgi:hypothetical protein
VRATATQIDHYLGSPCARTLKAKMSRRWWSLDYSASVLRFAIRGASTRYGTAVNEFAPGFRHHRFDTRPWSHLVERPQNRRGTDHLNRRSHPRLMHKIL